MRQSLLHDNAQPGGVDIVDFLEAQNDPLAAASETLGDLGMQ